MICKIALPAACFLAATSLFVSEMPVIAQTAAFGPENPFYAASPLPFHAPPFDRIKDSDYQPAIEAGMAEEEKEVGAIADKAEPATFENTFVAMEKTGQLLQRAQAALDCVAGANTNPTLQKVEQELPPKQAAHQDAIYLIMKLFALVQSF